MGPDAPFMGWGIYLPTAISPLFMWPFFTLLMQVNNPYTDPMVRDFFFGLEHRVSFCGAISVQPIDFSDACTVK